MTVDDLREWAAFCAGVLATQEGRNGEWGASDDWMRQAFREWQETGQVEHQGKKWSVEIPALNPTEGTQDGG